MKVLYTVFFVLIVGCIFQFPTSAVACEAKSSLDCGPGVPNATYKGGGVKVKVVKATVCFTPEILEAITLSNGKYAYTADFVYNPLKGTHEVIKTVKSEPCWTHHVPIGTWMAVYVTCRTYSGWVAYQVTGPTTSDPAKAPRMQKVSWKFAEKIG